MTNAAAKLDQDDVVFQCMGTIVRVEGPTFVVQTERGDLRARRAVSCLVEPLLHDYVLVGGQTRAGGTRADASRIGPFAAGARARAAYVLAVLERESPNAQLVCDGDLDVRLNNGKLRVAATEGMDVVTAKEVNMMASEVGIHTSRAKLFAAEILAIGSEVVGELANVKLKGTFLDKVFERVSERVQRSFRRVDEIDQLKAKQMDYLAEETLCLRSENMVAVAKELVKVDGEQIHFG